MGTKAAELRLLWSPFSCPSAEAPLKHKGAGSDAQTGRARSSVNQLMALLRAPGVSSGAAHSLASFKTVFRCHESERTSMASGYPSETLHKSTFSVHFSHWNAALRKHKFGSLLRLQSLPHKSCLINGCLVKENIKFLVLT